jgi:hypothetical protein
MEGLSHTSHKPTKDFVQFADFHHIAIWVILKNGGGNYVYHTVKYTVSSLV